MHDVATYHTADRFKMQLLTATQPHTSSQNPVTAYDQRGSSLCRQCTRDLILTRVQGTIILSGISKKDSVHAIGLQASGGGRHSYGLAGCCIIHNRLLCALSAELVETLLAGVIDTAAQRVNQHPCYHMIAVPACRQSRSKGCHWTLAVATHAWCVVL